MSQGVNRHGVEYTQLDEKTYHCRYYIGEGVEVEKTFFQLTAEALNRISLSDLLKKKSSNRLHKKK